MFRRRSARQRFPAKAGSVSSPAPAAATFDGLDNLTATDYYAAPAGIIGQQAGFHVQCWIWIEPTAVSASRIFLANATAAPGQGWRFLTGTTNATLNFGAYDGTGGLTRTSASLTLTAGHLQRPLHVCGGIRSGGLVLWVDGVAIGSPTTITTYTSPVAPTMSVGRRMQDTLSALGDIRVIGGIAGGHYAPSDAEVAAAYTTGLAAGDVVPITGGSAQQAWSFKGLGSAAASILPSVGAESLTKNGSPTYVTGL